MNEDKEVFKHDLSQYLEEINLTLVQDYSQIQKRVKEDPGTAGDQVEETWAGVFRHWLPSHYHVVTKGRIISSKGGVSPQIDILVLWANYPPFLLKKKLFMASGVAAAFECKLTLRKKHLRKLFETAVTLSKITHTESEDRKRVLRRTGKNFAYEEYHRIFEYGLLAHSYEGEDAEETAKTLTNEIRKLDSELVTHPNQMVDLVCVQDLGSWVSERKAIVASPIKRDEGYTMSYYQNPYTGYNSLTEKSWAKGSTIHENFSPLGSFLSRLYRKLSRVDKSLLPLSRFFTHTLSTGKGGGNEGRFWKELKTPIELWKLTEPQRLKHDYFLEGYTFLGF